MTELVQTCDVCGEPLPSDHDVRRHRIDDPIGEGYWNPLTPDTWVHLALGDDTEWKYSHTCPSCDPPETPPEPVRRMHVAHWGLFMAGVFVAGLAGNAPEAGAGVAVLGLICFAGTLGEMTQIERIEETDDKTESDVDPATDAHEAYLAGEITEGELEERLDEELADTEERDRKLLTER